ncbi:hypothetical protein FGIG_08283 [Fasciola gigantica]|uniref:Uncharacterized protein n=1 Tax=Fasciola gigantica TaxID=46835 RepID=A0A504YIW7_FASGI|nr:hypothetical protein FGIG_08283 [Fasciola gigantica]
MTIVCSLLEPDLACSTQSGSVSRNKTYVGPIQRGTELDDLETDCPRPTTASSFKQRGRCPICDQSPGERTVFGVDISRFGAARRHTVREIEKIKYSGGNVSVDRPFPIRRITFVANVLANGWKHQLVH